MTESREGAGATWRDRVEDWACWLTGAEPRELTRVLGLFLFNFLVITAYLIVKPVRNSLFIDRLGAANLPYAYIGTALFVGGVVFLYNRLLGALSRTWVFLVTWFALGGGLVAFWFGFRGPGLMVSALFYFFGAAFAVVGVTQFWSFAAEVLDARQGRRLFAFVQAGGIVGGLAGSLLTSSLAEVLGTEQLLLVSAGLCFLCGLLAASLSRAWPVEAAASKDQAEREDQEGRERMAAADGVALIRASHYLQLILVMLFCFQVVSTVIDYQFQFVVEHELVAIDPRTAFYGTFTLVMNAASLAFQFLVTGWIHRNHGLGPALVILPLAGLVGASGFFLWPVFVMGCALRGGFGTLDYSLDRATRELLYLPTSREVKYKAKAFLDMFCFRFFRSIAGILILVVKGFGGAGVQGLSLAVALFCGIWLVVAGRTRRENLRQLRMTLLGELEPSAPAPELTPEERQQSLTEIGFELARYAEAQGLPGQGAQKLGERSLTRLRELAARVYGPSDVPGCVAALTGSESTRALALELLDGLGDAWIGRPLFRVLDPGRSPEERGAFLELLRGRIGELPPRPEPRQVWSAAPPPPEREPSDSAGEER